MDKIIISVLLPVFNASAYIGEALESILNQTFPYFEVIIIDDKSTDNSVAIVEAINDDRIVLIKKQNNSGYTDSLNYALSIAKGKYIARMDADDISLPNRFEKQFMFLESNPDIILCGTWFELLDKNVIIKHPETNDEIAVALLEISAIGHPTIMFRKDEFVKHGLSYDKSMEPAEDYNLWVRVFRKGKLHNISEVLLKYRLHEGQVSVLKSQKQLKNAHLAKIFHISLLYGNHVPHVDITEIKKLDGTSFSSQQKYFNDFINELENINSINNKQLVFDIVLFNKYCQKRKALIVKKLFLDSSIGSFGMLIMFLNPANGYFRYFPNRSKINIMGKCLKALSW